MIQRNLILCFVLLAVSISAASAQKRHVVVEVKGLACPFCAYGLEKQFKEEPGVTEIKIDIDLGLLSFTLVNSSLGKKDIRKLVKKAGFTAGEVSINSKDKRGKDIPNP